MRIYRVAWAACLPALLAALIMASYAQGFSAVENDLEYRLDYPVEIKTGTCSAINFWMKASKTLTDVTVSLSVFYHRDSRVDTLYSEAILSESMLAAGSTKSKSISICVPRGVPTDPYLRAKIQFYYNGSERLSQEWYMSIVRDETYDELRSEVNKLRGTVSSLENELKKRDEKLSQLQDDYNTLLASYISLKESYRKLKEDLAKLEDDYRNLQKDYSSLQNSYESLRDKHQSTLLNLERINALYESLSRQFESLEEKYRSLLTDYESTLAELRTYKSMYEDLKLRHDDLRSRHDALIAEAAQLRQRLAELESDYSYLNRIYEATLGESSLTKNILFAQTAAVATGLGIYAVLSRRIARKPRTPETAEEGNGEKKVQKILSGRRITIPSEAAAKLGLKEGDLVEVDYGNGSIIIRPADREKPKQKPEESGKAENNSGA